MMTLKRKGQVGGAAILGLLLVTFAAGSFGISKVRFGGAMDLKTRALGAFAGDTMAPPLALLEPMLDASMLTDDTVRGRDTAPKWIEQLGKLETLYNAKYDAWSKAPEVDEDMKAILRERTHGNAMSFWKIVDQELIPAARRGDVAGTQAAHAKLRPLYQEDADAIADLLDITVRRSEQSDAAASSTTSFTIIVLAILGLGTAGAIVAALVFVVRKMLDPLAETADVMARMGAGDLEAGRRSEHRHDEIGTMTRAIEVFRSAALAQSEAEGKQRSVVESLSHGLGELAQGNLRHRIAIPLAAEYESLRQSFNETLGSLEELMRRVSGSAASVATGASEIRAASDDLALRNEQQAASLEETSAAMNQVTDAVKETAGGANDVQRAIADAHHEATEGGAVVARATEAMAAIEKSAQEITQIINVIDGIAFQTNLLALNAGVEAARAGDAGKGFAVVANEVRALAQRSAEAAKDIKELITASCQQVAGGVELVSETGVLLGKIVGRVGQVNGLISTIAESAGRQSVSLQQVNASVGEMDRMTQQNAAMVEQSTAAARSLANEAEELRRLVARFGSSEDGSMPIARLTPAPRLSRARSAPITHGNLALKQTETGGDDWSEF